MSTIVTRAVKGSPLTYAEMDANFNNLNTDKLQAGFPATSVANTPAGNIAAVTVQAAIDELDTEKLATTATALNGTTIPASKTLVVTTDIGSTVQAYVAPGTAGNKLQSNGSAWVSALDSQLQPITASIASNAITITPGALSLDFRNTTLTTGTVTRVSGTPSALVIAATDSFGLVTAYGNQRLAILAINNAGTIELAATALYGGVSLDETGVITTAATSTTATGIKAANVRTGVAYRVIGFIDATFTTAVGWGTLALVQGAGGNVATAMGSLGYGQTPQTVTRTSGTTYYNTTGRPIVLNVMTSGATTSYVLVVGSYSYAAVTSTASTALYSTFIIPPGMSYTPTYAGGVVTHTETR